jgi:hypothetical protein
MHASKQIDKDFVFETFASLAVDEFNLRSIVHFITTFTSKNFEFDS